MYKVDSGTLGSYRRKVRWVLLTGRYFYVLSFLTVGRTESGGEGGLKEFQLKGIRGHTRGRQVGKETAEAVHRETRLGQGGQDPKSLRETETRRRQGS